MLFFVERLLRLSMRMDRSACCMVRFLGKILGIFPVWYSERLERKLFRKGWKPGKASVRKKRKRTGGK